MDFKTIEEISAKYNAVLLRNESMALHTSFKIGGRCDALIKINSEDCLRETLLACREQGIPYYVLGNGSNVLVCDEGLRGLVIEISGDFAETVTNGVFIECGAGASLSKVCRIAKENALTGLEFAYGIPGTVGGAVYMNAGAYGGQMADVVSYCRYIDGDANVCEIGAEELGADFSYRRSFFTGAGKIITKVVFELKRGEISAIDTRMNELLQRRRDKQPLEFPSAGSTFKRPEGDYASRLIEACGLKGVSCGGAAVSEKHSGFVVNKGGATFEDVTGVIELVKEKVYKDTGVVLECEVEVFR